MSLDQGPVAVTEKDRRHVLKELFKNVLGVESQAVSEKIERSTVSIHGQMNEDKIGLVSFI